LVARAQFKAPGVIQLSHLALRQYLPLQVVAALVLLVPELMAARAEQQLEGL
jgi:hypothetical protein